jgi:hypothetical protein
VYGLQDEFAMGLLFQTAQPVLKSSHMDVEDTTGEDEYIPSWISGALSRQTLATSDTGFLQISETEDTTMQDHRDVMSVEVLGEESSLLLQPGLVDHLN